MSRHRRRRRHRASVWGGIGMAVMGIAYITWSLSWLVVSLVTLTVGVGCLFVGKDPPAVPSVPGVPAKRTKKPVSRKTTNRARRETRTAQVDAATHKQKVWNGLGFTTVKCSSGQCQHSTAKKEACKCACGGQNHGRKASQTKPRSAPKSRGRRTPRARTTPSQGTRRAGIRPPRPRRNPRAA